MSKSMCAPGNPGEPEPGSLGRTSRSKIDHKQLRELAEVIEKNVIPELMDAHGPQGRQRDRAGSGAGGSAGSMPASAIGEAETGTALSDAYGLLRRRLLDDRVDEAVRATVALVDGGVPLTRIYLELLAPIAREFGELWEDDELDFLAVTQALGGLQVILHRVAARGLPEPRRYDRTHSILIGRTTGDQHLLGLITVREFFRLAGWDVQGGIELEVGEGLVRAVKAQWFPLVGISLGSEAKAPELAKAIPEIRAASRNQRLGVLVGGPAFACNPGLFEAVGADALATDADQALETADRMLAEAFTDR